MGYGRFAGITDAIVNGLMLFNLAMWTWVVFRLIPRNYSILSVIILLLCSLGCWFGLDQLEFHKRQFFNTFLLFNVFGILMILAQRIKAVAFQSALLGLQFLIVILALLIKPIGLLTGLKSELDFEELEIMYHDQEHKIIKSKRTKKGYENIGERLEFHEDGTLKFYENYDSPVDTPWVEFHKNGLVQSINCYSYKTVDSKKVKSLYGVFFDETGIPRQASSTYGQVLRYHYNGFVFLSGYSKNNIPYGKWYFYSYADGSVVDSVDHSEKQANNWDQRNDLLTNRYAEKDSNIYQIRYDQKLMNGVQHYRTDSLYDFALSLKKRFDQHLPTLEE